MSIQWNEELSAGVDKIDNQHKEIITRINTLFFNPDAEDITEDEIDGIIRFFGGYTLDLFKTEEEFMIKYEYPDYDTHKAQHMKFLKHFATLKKLCEEEDTISVMLFAIKNQAVDWLINHFNEFDKKMAAFLRTKT